MSLLYGDKLFYLFSGPTSTAQRLYGVKLRFFFHNLWSIERKKCKVQFNFNSCVASMSIFVRFFDTTDNIVWVIIA